MYVPSPHAMDDPDEVARFVDAHAVGQLVTVGPDGAPDATLLPVLLGGGLLIAHLARANPQVARIVDGSRGLVVVSGADAYVSPGWYASKAEHGRVVPTWNYSAVHLAGVVRVVDDPDWVLDVVTRLTDRHEATLPQPWQVDDAPPRWIRGRLRAIVGIEMVVDRVEGKAKLSQNRSDADRDGTVRGLRSRGQAGADAVADAVNRELRR